MADRDAVGDRQVILRGLELLSEAVFDGIGTSLRFTAGPQVRGMVGDVANLHHGVRPTWRCKPSVQLSMYSALMLGL